MIFVLTNLALFIVLLIVYKRTEARQSKSMFYNPLWKNMFITFVAPIVCIIFNVIILILLNLTHYLYIPFLLIIIPIISWVVHLVKEKFHEKEYNILVKQIKPIIFSLLKEKSLNISQEDIQLVYYKQYSKKHLDIRIDIPANDNKEIISVRKELEREVNNRNLTTDIVTQILFQKKSNLPLSLIL
ncbi:hypothetical protein Q3A90_18195 [Priestia megaterium]|uniref:hypothetical protein n=1 Tax=Priestia megaterium TaxID=1404 RepID=UPI0026752319|nr:hypothetical protein [Priestia megaterium]WKU21700.1 hypothetical protein Q3A90_18195 [Priestia megaterium]